MMLLCYPYFLLAKCGQSENVPSKPSGRIAYSAIRFDDVLETNTHIPHMLQGQSNKYRILSIGNFPCVMRDVPERSTTKPR